MLARRTRIAWSSCQGLDLLSMLTDLAQRYVGMSQATLERQAEEYRQFLQRGFAFRGDAMTAKAGFHDGGH